MVTKFERLVGRGPLLSLVVACRLSDSKALCLCAVCLCLCLYPEDPLLLLWFELSEEKVVTQNFYLLGF